MRNILAHVGHIDKAVFAAKLKQIWLQPNKELAKQYGEQITPEYVGRYPEAINMLEEGLEDSLQFYSLDTFDARKISSMNVLELLNKEIRRRSRVVGVFPSEDSYVRLITCFLIEYSEDWGTSRSYIKQEIIEELRARLKPEA